ncbi:MAG TPA: hypothetical protein IGS17_01130 [Oscillatoriales cyanobacterium M59_W2019_021]|nr:hypothetical protein [Oscillatoriales cyanobacterium M4454_W2019_049]HIK49517.1 hypothetical protein [Oscillatoriales cyanobacterium M59_W2019_021]
MSLPVILLAIRICSRLQVILRPPSGLCVKLGSLKPRTTGCSLHDLEPIAHSIAEGRSNEGVRRIATVGTSFANPQSAKRDVPAELN